MSDLTQAAVISGSIFAAVMATQYGRRELTSRALLRPLVVVAIFGWIYLRHLPLGSRGDLSAYGVALVLGLLFGAAATLVTQVVRDRDGIVRTVTGPAFATIWALAVVLRLGFIWAVENVQPVREHFGSFMFGHDISLDVIAPFFVIWALTMVVARVAVVAGRASALRATPVDEPVDPRVLTR
jgi:hypothetical protein